MLFRHEFQHFSRIRALFFRLHPGGQGFRCAAVSLHHPAVHPADRLQVFLAAGFFQRSSSLGQLYRRAAEAAEKTAGKTGKQVSPEEVVLEFLPEE